VQGGNRNAYAEIVRRYEAKVRGYCLSMLGDSFLAEDAAQEIFLKAYQSLEQFQWKSSFSTWLYRITSNHCTDLLRKKIRQKTESWDALVEKDGERIEALLALPPDRGQSGEYKELIAKLLAHLPEKSRQILMLREVQGLSYEELAQTLECTVDAVKARLKRTRQELDEKLRHFLKAGDV